MSRIELEIYSDDPKEVAALEAYWRLAGDGESWVQTVAAVRSELGLKQQELTRIIQTCATAYLPEIRCSQCGEPHAITSRTDLARVLRLGNVHCSACRAAAQVERERAEQERIAQRRAAVAEVFPILCDSPIDIPDLTLFEAAALHALFTDPAVEDAGMTTPTDIWPKEREWAPARLRYEFERRLLQAKPSKVCVHPDSHTDAFVWEDDSPTGSIYLGRVSYYLLHGRAFSAVDECSHAQTPSHLVARRYGVSRQAVHGWLEHRLAPTCRVLLDLPGRLSLIRVITRCCSVSYGQIQATRYAPRHDGQGSRQRRR